MVGRITRLLLLLLCLSGAVLGCTKKDNHDSDSDRSPKEVSSDDKDEDEDKDDEEEEEEEDSDSRDNDPIRCGVVVDGKLKKKVSEDDGLPVTIRERVGQNLFIVRSLEERDVEEILIKLHGIGADLPPQREELADFFIKDKMRERFIFVQAEKDCTFLLPDGGRASIGSLVEERSGESLAEEMLLVGVASPDSQDLCGGELLAECFTELSKDASLPTGADISDFLWKPASDRDGNLAVLLNPAGATVVVNGETLVDSGPGNGRGTTARSNKPGCAYGANVRVEAFDRQGRLLLFPGGQASLTIADGCQRVEIP